MKKLFPSIIDAHNNNNHYSIIVKAYITLTTYQALYI